MLHGYPYLGFWRVVPWVALLLSVEIPGASAQQNAGNTAVAAGLYVQAAALAEKLRNQALQHADPALAPISITDAYSIQEVHRDKPGPPAIHAGWTELHYILAGSADFVTGGTIKGDVERIIEGGVSHIVRAGDAVIVPADTPHWYRTIDASLTVLEVRFVAPKPASP
jgi:mannose-6-phosphate isomerase-like protein (cupin superfamily)